MTREKIALSIRNHLLNPKTSKDLGEPIKLIYNAGPLKTLIQVQGRYFSVKIQEHGGSV